MQIVEVTKETTFDCAHILSGYNGLCGNLHGHTYKMEVTVGGCIQEDGMVIDFSDLKQAMKEVVEPLDHAIILAGDQLEPAEEELALQAWAKQFNKKCYVFPIKRTTAELMAGYLARKLLRKLDIVYHIKVKLYETPTSYAEVTVYGHDGHDDATSDT